MTTPGHTAAPVQFRRPGSVLGSRGGQILASAEAVVDQSVVCAVGMRQFRTLVAGGAVPVCGPGCAAHLPFVQVASQRPTENTGPDAGAICKAIPGAGTGSYKIIYSGILEAARRGRNRLIPLVGAGRFELPTPCAQGGFWAPSKVPCFQIFTFQTDTGNRLKPVEPY